MAYYLFINDVCIREEPNGEKKCMLSVKDSYYHDMIWRACNIGGMYKNVQEERKQRIHNVLSPNINIALLPLHIPFALFPQT